MAQTKKLAGGKLRAILRQINATPDHTPEDSGANVGGPLESCAHFARRGCSPTPDHDADYAGRSKRVEEEQRLLLQWIEENPKLGRPGRLPPTFARGGEHAVYFHKRARRYFKATRTDRHWGYGIALGSIVHGATPSEYLDRLLLQNSLFDDDIRLERIVANQNKPIIITSQPAIKGVQASQTAIDCLMQRKAYRKLTDGAYYDQGCGLLVYDLFPRNALLAADGEVYPIDPVIQRVTQEFAEFLEAQPHTINLRG